MDKEQPQLAKYLDEALGLGIFMFSAGFFDMLIDHPELPVRQMIHDDLLRRFLIGLSMGLTGLSIFTSRFGKASGAYINPSVTLVRFLLGDISLKNALFYAVFQFLGGVAGMFLVYLLFPGLIANPAINYIVTAPSAGLPVAFVMEFAISLFLIIVVLFTDNSKVWAKYTPFFVAALITLYITFEAPYSGMSMNPARTFASAIVAGQWHAFWLYCTAPTLGMLAGAWVFVLLTNKHFQLKSKDHGIIPKT